MCDFVNWDSILESSWLWLVLGFLLIALETFAPGAFLLWIGLASFLVWILSLFLPLTLVVKLCIFAFLSPLITWVGKFLFKKYSKSISPILLNRRADQLIGRDFVLDQPIIQGRAHVSIGDSLWKIKGPNLPLGTLVKIVAVDGMILEVEEVFHDSCG